MAEKHGRDGHATDKDVVVLRLRFNTVFAALLALAFLSAFVLPPQLGNRLRGMQAVFAPVSRPTRAVASAARNKIAPIRHRDTRDVTDVKDENERLRVMVMSLSGQLEELRRVTNDLDKLGDVRQHCTRFKVIGDDAGLRDSLLLAASTRHGPSQSASRTSGTSPDRTRIEGNGSSSGAWSIHHDVVRTAATSRVERDASGSTSPMAIARPRIPPKPPRRSVDLLPRIWGTANPPSTAR